MIVAIVLAILNLFAPVNANVIVVPPMPQYSPETIEAAEWEMYRYDAYEEYEDEFTALFNSYETKWSKNGRLMIRQGDSGSFKFAKKG